MNSYIFDGSSIQNRRKTNMDCLLIKEKKLNKRKICLAVVCDGVGSLNDGAFASSRTVHMLGEWFDTITDISRIGIRLRDKVIDIDKCISWEATQMNLQTGTTISAILIDGESYYIVHAGDSRIYCAEEEGLKRLTYDQVENGKLTSCLGHGVRADLFYNEGQCHNKRFLLCSDGLYKKADERFLTEMFLSVDRKTCKKILSNLMQHAIYNGETDNISAAIVICES